MKKRIVLLFSLAALCLSAVAPEGSGGEPLVIRGDYVLRGTALVQYQGKTEQNLVIPPDLGITGILDEAFQSNRLLSVAIPEGVRKLGAGAFKDCYNLVSVRIPRTLTGIGAGAFTECGKLKEIKVDRDNPAYRDEEGVLLSRDLSTLVYYPAGKETPEYSVPNGVKTIQGRAFQGAGYLTSLRIPAGVTHIGEDAFSQCKSLTSIILPTSLVIIGESAFFDCSGLTSVTIPAGVTAIGERGAFWKNSPRRTGPPGGSTRQDSRMTRPGGCRRGRLSWTDRWSTAVSPADGTSWAASGRITS